MARLTLAFALLFSVLALGAADDSRLLELLETLLDNRDLETRQLKLDQLKSTTAKSSGDLKKAGSFFVPILQASSRDTKVLEPVCEHLIKVYRDDESDLKKALTGYDKAYSGLRAKIGLTRSVDDDEAMEERMVRLRLLVDLAGRQVERASTAPPTKDDIETNNKEIVDALNEVVNEVNELVNDDPSGQSLLEIKKILGRFNKDVLYFKNIIHYFEGYCSNAGFNK